MHDGQQEKAYFSRDPYSIPNNTTPRNTSNLLIPLADILTILSLRAENILSSGAPRGNIL